MARNSLLSQQLAIVITMPAMPPGPWGAALKALRLEKGWAMKKLAKKAKMTATTYGRIEKGGHTLTSQLQDLADALGVPIDAVLLPGGRPTQSELDAIFNQKVRDQLREYLASSRALDEDDARTRHTTALREKEQKDKDDAEKLRQATKEKKKKKKRL